MRWDSVRPTKVRVPVSRAIRPSLQPACCPSPTFALRAAGELRAQKEVLHQRHVAKMASHRPADDEALRSCSLLLNARLRDRFPPPATCSWFKLFTLVDDDGSGKISFDELVRMVRGELQLGVAEVSEHELKSVWLALDREGSG